MNPEENKEKVTISVDIAEVGEDGSCISCNLCCHTYHDTLSCVINLALEVSIFDKIYPGPGCPRYNDSQEKRASYDGD
jgi:hypothetical protein